MKWDSLTKPSEGFEVMLCFHWYMLPSYLPPPTGCLFFSWFPAYRARVTRNAPAHVQSSQSKSSPPGWRHRHSFEGLGWILVMEEIRRSPVEVGNLSQYCKGFKRIQGGCLGFLNHQRYVNPVSQLLHRGDDRITQSFPILKGCNSITLSMCKKAVTITVRGLPIWPCNASLFKATQIINSAWYYFAVDAKDVVNKNWNEMGAIRSACIWGKRLSHKHKCLTVGRFPWSKATI